MQPPSTPPGQQQLQERQLRERQVQPPPGQQQLQERQLQERQVQPPPTPPGQQQLQERQGVGPAIQSPPRPIAPQQPVGQPTIAPSAVQEANIGAHQSKPILDSQRIASTVPAPHSSRASNSSKWVAKMPTPRPMSSIDERVGIKTDEDQRLAKLLQTLAVIATVVSTSDKLPNAFNGLSPLQDNLGVAGNLIYFSFVTLTTVGYGDLVPLHPIARALANVEAIIGQLYPATLLARLVTLEIENRRKS